MKNYKYTYKEKEYWSLTDLLKHEDFADNTFLSDLISDTSIDISKLAKYGVTQSYHIPTMVEVKEDKYKELEAARKNEEMSPISLPNVGTFEFDEDSQRRLTYAINSLTNDETRSWSLADSSPIQVSRPMLEKLFHIAIVRSDATFDKLKRLKALVAPCTTKEQVEAIKWDMDELNVGEEE